MEFFVGNLPNVFKETFAVSQARRYNVKKSWGLNVRMASIR